MSYIFKHQGKAGWNSEKKELTSGGKDSSLKMTLPRSKLLYVWSRNSKD